MKRAYLIFLTKSYPYETIDLIIQHYLLAPRPYELIHYIVVHYFLLDSGASRRS